MFVLCAPACLLSPQEPAASPREESQAAGGQALPAASHLAEDTLAASSSARLLSALSYPRWPPLVLAARAGPLETPTVEPQQGALHQLGLPGGVRGTEKA